MENGIKYYNMRVLPLVVEKESGDGYVDNLSNEETNNMSAEERMLWHIGNQIYLAEKPLTYRGNEMRKKLYYVFDELNSEEQEMYADRSTFITVTKNYVVPIYDENSKRLFPQKNTENKPKKRVKKNK